MPRHRYDAPTIWLIVRINPQCVSPGLMLATYHCSVCGLRDRAQIGGPALIRRTSEGARPYMQPTNLKAIAREAALRGDTKTLFNALDLLERQMPIART